MASIIVIGAFLKKYYNTKRRKKQDFTLQSTSNVHLCAYCIKVYDQEDIAIAYSYSSVMKESSKGEEFKISTIDSFGDVCDISIAPANNSIVWV